MTEIRCTQCSAAFELPDGYGAPYIKCPACGSHQKNTRVAVDEPVYRVLDQAGRQRASQQTRGDLPEPVSSADEKPVAVARQTHKVADPVIAPAQKKQAEAMTRIDHKVVGRPVSEQQILEDTLGKNGMEMVFQLVAGYLDELSETRRRNEKTKAMQVLMRAKFPAEIAARAVEFAEKSPNTMEIILGNYLSALRRGLAIFAVGVVISLGVHFLAHPGREFVFFQLPFAVGLAYTCNALLGLAGLKIPALHSNAVHYGFLSFASLIILAYVVWGVFF
ncbi:MAG TPA: hypothetical protein PLM07_13540 [Candidatus Rifleibacterium sp.]|nr:hypothetical protein [Candidatus Rifleibacterium sp.]